MTHPQDDFFEPQSAKARISQNVLAQMVRGAGIGALIFFSPLIFVYLVYLLGTLLPEDSKDAADPTPDSFSHWERVADTDLV